MKDVVWYSVRKCKLISIGTWWSIEIHIQISVTIDGIKWDCEMIDVGKEVFWS